MKVAGIIAEYNPFHNGHAYQVQLLKEKYHFDYVIAVMSGDFVQRGTPAILDKYQRTRMALHSGVDLVLELPVLWSTASAEFFASAGISLLQGLGVVDTVCFGCECPNEELLHWTSSILCEEPLSYQDHLASFLKSGYSFPASRMQALLLEKELPFSKEALTDFLQAPNNILALEYEKAIKTYAPGLNSLPIQRTGSNFHSTELLGTICSATALRQALLSKDSSLSVFTPSFAFTLLEKASFQSLLLTEDDFFSLLKYKLLCTKDFSPFADCNQDISNKLNKYKASALSFSELAGKLKSKDLTYTRICRILIHILLDLKKDSLEFYKVAGFTPYARILGFHKDSSKLLTALKKDSSLPLISKVSDAKSFLNQDALALLEMDIHASDIYHIISAEHSHVLQKNDYNHELEILL